MHITYQHYISYVTIDFNLKGLDFKTILVSLIRKARKKDLRKDILNLKSKIFGVYLY